MAVEDELRCESEGITQPRYDQNQQPTHDRIRRHSRPRKSCEMEHDQTSNRRGLKMHNDMRSQITGQARAKAAEKCSETPNSCDGAEGVDE